MAPGTTPKLTLGDFPQVSQPALRALEAAGITRLEQLTKFSEAEIAGLHGMGPKGIRILKQALKERGLLFGSEK